MQVYAVVAIKLTEWELHRTQTEHDDSFTFKMFLFQVIICHRCANIFHAFHVLLNRLAKISSSSSERNLVLLVMGYYMCFYFALIQ